MTQKLQKLFKINQENADTSKSLELFFDFVVVAIVSLIFNGFIINSHAAPADQMFNMVLSAGLLVTHYYAQSFFRQRYEKKGSFFRIWTFLKLFGLGMIAVGLDLMVFRLNGNDHTQEFLRWFSPLLFVSGIIFTRLLTTIEFLFAAYANRESSAVIKLTIYKALSRFVVMLLAIVHLILIVEDKTLVAETTYIFMPIYLIIELIGNFIFVTKKVLSQVPLISPRYSKERFTRLNILFISSLIVSGTTQFAFYFKTEDDLYMLWRLAITYFIAFLMWWLYADRVYRMNLKMEPRNMVVFNVLSLVISMAMAIFGAMIINSNNNANMDIIIPSVLISFAVILAFIDLSMVILTAEGITKLHKIKLIASTLPLIISSLILGLVSIWVDMPFWIIYLVVPVSLVILNTHSRYVIWTASKSIKM